MKARHKNLGIVEVLGPDKDGLTPCRTAEGQLIEASTPYLTPIQDDVERTDSGFKSGD